MRIQEEMNYRTFAANIATMKSTISNAIQNKEIVDDQFNTIKKYSFKWVVLSLMRPLYAFFGQDASAQVRVDAVARNVLRYCELNKKYLTKPLQLEVASEVLERLNAKTNRKYSSIIGNVANTLETMCVENNVILEETGKILLTLHEASWDEGIPKIQEMPSSFLWIPPLLRNASDSSLIDPVIASSLRNKCWEYACSVQDAKEAIFACKTCKAAFQGQDIDDPYLAKTTVVFRADEKIIMPEFYKRILANSSVFFKKFFESGFREKGASEVFFPKMHRKHFLNMLGAIETGTLTLKDYKLHELTNFAKQMDRFGLKGVHEQALQHVAIKLREFPVDQEHLERVDQLASLPYLMSATGEYYDKYLSSSACDSKEKLLFVELRKEHITRLTLDNCSVEEMGKLVACCPNLETLDLSECNSFHDNTLEQLKGCTKLKSLNLRSWKNLTNDGLQHVLHLPSLKNLDVSDCCQISRKRLESLDAEVRKRVVINTFGCLEDVEERRKVEAQAIPRAVQPNTLQAGYAAGYMAGRFSGGFTPESSAPGYAAGFYAGRASRRF